MLNSSGRAAGKSLFSNSTKVEDSSSYSYGPRNDDNGQSPSELFKA